MQEGIFPFLIPVSLQDSSFNISTILWMWMCCCCCCCDGKRKWGSLAITDAAWRRKFLSKTWKYPLTTVMLYQDKQSNCGQTGMMLWLESPLFVYLKLPWWVLSWELDSRALVIRLHGPGHWWLSFASERLASLAVHFPASSCLQCVCICCFLSQHPSLRVILFDFPFFPCSSSNKKTWTRYRN